LSYTKIGVKDFLKKSPESLDGEEKKRKERRKEKEEIPK